MTDYFDFVIVGAGSAGCVLANRLSADSSVRVALLEAGGSNAGPIIAMPAATDFYGIGNPLYDWRYMTAPDATRLGRVDVWPRGRGLGGSSAINGLVHMQGRPSDFAAWQAAGCDGWGWDDVAPAYASILAQANGSGDGSGGLVVNDLLEVHPTAKMFVASARAAGIALSSALATAAEPGVGFVQANYLNGRRVSNARAFLDPARGRKNLKILTRCRASRILFQGSRATGVAYDRPGRRGIIHAGHVIVSAGTIASPQLLQLSGIGPAHDLEKLGIPVLVDSPGVGANLQDHASVYLTHHVGLPTLNNELGWLRRARHGLDWWLHGRGPGTSPGGQALAYLRTRPDIAAPDIQVQFTPIGYTLKDGKLSVPKAASVTAVVSLNRPQSRGFVRLASTDCRVAPIIAPELFSAPADLHTLRDGLRMAANLIRSGPLGAELGAPLPPTVGEGADDAELEHAIRKYAGTNFHPVGTCRMGRSDTPLAVVDNRLAVRGAEGLSVIDASVMPMLVSANTNATVTMIAERGAGFLI